MAPPVTVETVARHSHRYVLPLAGAAALVLGTLSLVVERPEIARYLPFALLGVGVAAVIAAFAAIPGHRARVEGGVRSAGHDGLAIAANRIEGIRSPTDAPVDIPHPHAPVSGLGRTAVSVVAHLGDDLWGRWATPTTAPLGVALVGPVPETAYTSPPPGGFAPFPEKDKDALFLTDDGLRPASPLVVGAGPMPVAPTGRGVPVVVPTGPFGRSRGVGPTAFSDEELDRMFPPDGEGILADSAVAELEAIAAEVRPRYNRAPPAEASASPRQPSAPIAADPEIPRDPSAPDVNTPPGASWDDLPDDPSIGEAPSISAGAMGTVRSLDLLDHPRYLDASDPALPRLGRIPDARVVARARAGAPRARPVARHCGDCDRTLVDFHAWAPCPECREPMCRLCLSVSLLNGALGSCRQCRGLTNAAAS